MNNRTMILMLLVAQPQFLESYKRSNKKWGMETWSNGCILILSCHFCKNYRFLDKAAYISLRDLSDREEANNPWRLCPVTQVEEVKCILRLIPIWLCTIIYSVVFTQMASLFVEQGAAMKTTISNFHIPPASMSSFDILSVALFIFLYRGILDPFIGKLKKSSSKGLTELQRMGVGLIIAMMAMVLAGIVE